MCFLGLLENKSNCLTHHLASEQIKNKFWTMKIKYHLAFDSNHHKGEHLTNEFCYIKIKYILINYLNWNWKLMSVVLMWMVFVVSMSIINEPKNNLDFPNDIECGWENM